MASNPMQKKSRNSFLLGMLLMLIIAAIAMAGMFFLLKRNEKKQEEQAATQSYVYRLKQNVKSGETITSSMVESVLVNSEAIPDGAAKSKKEKKDTSGQVVKENGQTVWETVSFVYNGYKSKIDLGTGTIVSENMLYKDEKLEASERIQEYNMLKLPIQLDFGEYVDVRLQMSNGQDFIVVSHKEVKDINVDTIWLQLSEEEIILMSNAIVEAYISPASNLYVTKYVEPGTQTAAAITYVPSDIVVQSMKNNPNIVKDAMDALKAQYESDIGNGQKYSEYYRFWINSELEKYSDNALDNIQAQMLEAREKAREAREEFLNGVN